MAWESGAFSILISQCLFPSYDVIEYYPLTFWASSFHMLVRRKQKPKDDQRPVPHMLPWQVTECERRDLSNSGTAELAKLSKLSAKMVELSLQETGRDPTVRGTVPNKLSAVSPPLLWPSTCVHMVAPPAESAARAGAAAPNPAVPAATAPDPPHPHPQPAES